MKCSVGLLLSEVYSRLYSMIWIFLQGVSNELCCFYIAWSPDNSLKRAAYVSRVLHYKAIIQTLTNSLGRSECVCVMCFWRDSEKGDHVHVGDTGRVWWWKSGLTGLTSISLVCCYCLVSWSLSLFSICAAFHYICFLEIGTYKSCAARDDVSSC